MLYDMKFAVCHAEVNAILNKNCSSVKNCTIYVALFPCNECAKVIIQSGIKLVKYVSDKHATKKKTIAAKKMFDAAGITYRYFSYLNYIFIFLNLYKCQKYKKSYKNLLVVKIIYFFKFVFPKIKIFSF